MTKLTMPEPVAWMLECQTLTGDTSWKLSWEQSGESVCHRLTGENYEKALITTDQAEAYAEDRVRVALEAAAKVAMGAPITADMLDSEDAKAVCFHAASKIRALIPKENKS